MNAPPLIGEIRPFAVTHGTVIRLAVPMMIAYISVPLVGVIDTAVIGQLGIAALIGGIAVGAIILDIVFITFNFLRAGTTGLTAQAYGAEDPAEGIAVLGRALVLAAVCGVVIVALQWPMIEAGVAIMNPGAEVADAAREYLYIRIWASPFGLMNFVLLGWLLGIHRSLMVLGIQTLFASLNIGLSMWFVLGLGYGVAGVAWSSVLAEFLTLLAQVPLILWLAPPRSWPARPRLFERRGFTRLIGVNRDIMIRSFTLLFAFAFFTRQGAQFGEVTLAANALLMHFFVVGGYFLDGFATAAEQLAGRAVGALYRPAFDRMVRLTAVWAVVTALILSAVFAVAGPALIDLMTTSVEVRETTRTYLVWAVLTPLAGVIAFQMDGIYIGATWSREMRNMMLLSLVLYLVAWAILTPLFGNHGLWMALLIFLGARSVTLPWRMRTLVAAHVSGLTRRSGSPELLGRERDDAAEAGDEMAGLDPEAVKREIRETGIARGFGVPLEEQPLQLRIVVMGERPGERQPARRHAVRRGLAHEEQRGARVAENVLRMGREAREKRQRREVRRRRRDDVGGEGAAAGTERRKRRSAGFAQQVAGKIGLQGRNFSHFRVFSLFARNPLPHSVRILLQKRGGWLRRSATKIRKDPACRLSRSSTTTATS